MRAARRRLMGATAMVAAIGGAIVAWHYQRLGLTLSHYDARAHLVVARRIIDSLTPGWQQIGGVWLPLPHLLNALPVQNDFSYRTGASAVAMSIASYALATGAIAGIVLELTESAYAAVVSAAVFALNPNVLYLQATPMTEPLLLALTTLGVGRIIGKQASADDRSCRTTGVIFALACLTRYEAWPVTAAALAANFWANLRRRDGVRLAARKLAMIALYPALAVAGFAIFSRVVVGAWFVSTDFYVPENKALHDAIMAVKEIAWGSSILSGTEIIWAGAAGLMIVLIRGLADRQRAHTIAVAALACSAILPLAAFYQGHPFRIRYMVPLIAIEAIGCGVVVAAVAMVAKTAAVALRCQEAITAVIPPAVISAFLVLALIYAPRPLDASAPMVVEAQWDRPNSPERARVTACLGPPGRGEKIMASMGSLGHYMQETANAGYRIRDFLHEGNGDIWLAALVQPRPSADWIMIEEKAQGGDMLARLARKNPRFLDGYSRVCEGAGLALYRREPTNQNLKLTMKR